MWKKMAVVMMTALMVCLSTACRASSTDNTEPEAVLQDGTDTSKVETDTAGNIVTNLEKTDLRRRAIRLRQH